MPNKMIAKIRELIANDYLDADDCVMAIDKLIADEYNLPLAYEPEAGEPERKRLKKLFEKLGV